MAEYLVFVAMQTGQNKSIEAAVKFCDELIKKLLSDFQGGIFNYEHLPVILPALQSITPVVPYCGSVNISE